MVAHEPMYASSHSHSIYPTSRNSITYGRDHNLAYGHNILTHGHEHAPAYGQANTIYGHDHVGSAKAGWVRVAGHTKPSSADKRQVIVRFHVLDEKVFLPLILEVVKQSRKAVGCISSEVVKNADEKASDKYALIQTWRTKEDGERYNMTPLVQEILARCGEGKSGLDRSKGRDGVEITDYTSLAADAKELKIKYA